MSDSQLLYSPDEVWRYLRETAEILRTLGQETDKKFLETDRKFLETDKRFSEMDHSLQELKLMFLETDKKFLETDRKFQETDKKISELAVQIGNLGNRLGEFVEEMVLPSALRIFQERGIEVQEIYPRVRAKRKTGGTEIDLLLVNSTEAVAVEVKSALSFAHVDEHLQRLERFKTLFPLYTNFHVYGAVAGMVVTDSVADYAINHGFFVIKPAADTMQLANSAAFQPRSW